MVETARKCDNQDAATMLNVVPLQLPFGAQTCSDVNNACPTSGDPSDAICCRSFHSIFPNIVEFCGPSRCFAFSGTCTTWATEMRTMRAWFHNLTKRKLYVPMGAPARGRGDGNSALVDLLSAPDSACRDAAQVVDEAYSLLAGVDGAAPERLRAFSKITDYADVSSLVARLRSQCKISGDAVDAVFGPRVQRGQMLLLWPRAVHYALLQPSSTRLVRMLAFAAESAGVLDEVMQRTRPANRQPQAISPLLFAAMFAEQDVVEALKAVCHGRATQGSQYEPNAVDVQVVQRLQRERSHWEELRQRMHDLGLAAEAARLDDKVAQQRDALEQYRAKMRTTMHAEATAALAAARARRAEAAARNAAVPRTAASAAHCRPRTVAA
mmetsp:Transcript_107046/g.301205  ORF Transcript_107046/g.301205 Transcript_107046/m.301205 type:complete len:382 (-) Transcript_107046:127-1272(-)